MKVSVIIPTYNERGNIEKLVDTLISVLRKGGMKHEIVIVDDKSPDGTWEVAKVLAKKHDIVHAIVRENERGLASAIRRGVEESSGDTIVLMDTDFSHEPNTLLEFLKKIEKNDVVVGSRYVSGGKMEGPIHKFLGSYLINLLARIVLGLKVKDSTGGFVCFRRKILKGADLGEIFQGYGDYCIRLLYHAQKGGFRIVEVPFVYSPRYAGESKTSFFTVGIKYGITILKLRF